jgi:hypothetical protein
MDLMGQWEQKLYFCSFICMVKFGVLLIEYTNLFASF